MRISDTKPIKIKPYTNTKDDEGNPFVGYSDDNAFTINAYVYHVSGQEAALQYGDRLSYIYKMLCDEPYNPVMDNGVLKFTDGTNTISVKDGVCVYSDKEEFQIISIEQHGHLVVTMEMIR